jgi:hydrogenase/urease accessory protein HupE
MKAILKKIHILNHVFVPLSIVGVFVSFIFRSSPMVQYGILMSLVLLYVSLALAHHSKNRNLTLTTTLEYILIATLAIVILTGIIM